MKKLLALLLVFLMLIATFAGCAKGGEVSSEPDSPSSDVSSEEDVVSDEIPSDEEEVSSEEETIDEPEYEEPEYEEPEDEFEEEEKPLTPEQLRMQTMLAGDDKSLNEDALYNEGDLARLAKAIKKSQGGKSVTLLFYGNGANTGRIMDQANAEVLYSSLVYDWWQTNIGPCEIIKSGTDNLTSITACMRVEHDVLRYNPDVVFLDFAVQDGIKAMAKTNALGYDNLIRRILQSKSAPAVISLMLTGAEQQSYTMNPQNATIFPSAATEQKKVAKYYNLPIIDFEQSFWDNSIEVVEVTSKKEIPLVCWDTIGSSNVVMNNEGHSTLAGTIKYFISNVLKKLNKVSTKDYAYPTEGYFANDKYMTGSYVSIGDIIEGKAEGYSINLDMQSLAANEYNYAKETFENSMTPHIKTWRHFDYIEGFHKEQWKVNEENPEYLTITLPEPIEGESYVLFSTTSSVGNRGPADGSPIKDYYPISVECYSESGGLLNTLKAEASNYAETTTMGKSTTVKLNAHTAKITIKVWTSGGSVYIHGISNFAK